MELQKKESTRGKLYPIFALIASLVGLLAAFTLTVEKFEKLANPSSSVGCDFSVIVQCSANLDSWQGSLLGFPNPLIGLMAWPFILFMAVALLAGAVFPRWLWRVYMLGITAGLGFVIWLISQSIFVLGTLCPWCMVTWAAMIPLFLSTLIYAGSRGYLFGAGKTADFLRKLRAYLPVLLLLSFATIALLAQLRLDVLSTL